MAATSAILTQARWPTTPARGRCPGGQDRPTGGSRTAERDLRGRLSRVLVWARHVMRAGAEALNVLASPILYARRLDIFERIARYPAESVGV